MFFIDYVSLGGWFYFFKILFIYFEMRIIFVRFISRFLSEEKACRKGFSSYKCRVNIECCDFCENIVCFFRNILSRREGSFNVDGED